MITLKNSHIYGLFFSSFCWANHSFQKNFKEHGGLKESGEPDPRVGTGQFAHGKVDASEAGKKGGETSGSSAGGHAASGVSEAKGGGEGGQFGAGKVDPVEAGKKGGMTS